MSKSGIPRRHERVVVPCILARPYHPTGEAYSSYPDIASALARNYKLSSNTMIIPYLTDRARVAVLLRRKEGLTKQEFDHYWYHKHAPLLMSLDIVKGNVLKYEQAHTHSQLLSKVSGYGYGHPEREWDGIEIFEGRCYEDLTTVFNSSEYQDKVFKDEEVFLDRSKCQMIPLDLVPLVE